MIFIESCSIKLNLALRVHERRADGYHGITTVFWRLPSPETLEIAPGAGDEDTVTCSGAEIEGENIVARACRRMRAEAGARGPVGGLRVTIAKRLPPGSGVGAGSGNAAAFVRWWGRTSGAELNPASLAPLGADVAFLSSGMEFALASGAGELLEPLSPRGWRAGGTGYTVMIFFPPWASGTASAYRALDELREAGGAAVTDERKARAEALNAMALLALGEPVGLLPNDFIAVQRPECEAALAAIGASGASAWGLCGSGSACFGLYRAPFTDPRGQSALKGFRVYSCDGII